MGPWRNWQTRMLEGHVPARACWFDSSRAHCFWSSLAWLRQDSFDEWGFGQAAFGCAKMRLTIEGAGLASRIWSSLADLVKPRLAAPRLV